MSRRGSSHRGSSGSTTVPRWFAAGVFGFGPIILPVLAACCMSLISINDLHRRVARYREMRGRLETARKEASSARTWGALEHVDCLHFELAYYTPLEWALSHNIAVIEGGAQGAHKLARGFEPVQTQSAHWLAHPGFADAVEKFLEQERAGVSQYLGALKSPFRDEIGD